MATTSTKMIDKQIATAEKKIQKLQSNIERYKGLAEKKYAKLVKFYPALPKYSFSELREFTAIFGSAYWDLAYGYFDNLRSIADNEKDLKYEEKHLNNLLTKKENTESTNDEYIKSTQVLVDKFEELLVDYKKAYFDDCEKKFAKLYKKMKDAYPHAKEIIKRANKELPYFFGTYNNYNYNYIAKHFLGVKDGELGYYSFGTYIKKFVPFTEKECELISEWKVAYNVTHSDCQGFNVLEDYLKYKMEAVSMDWDVKLRTFADKCNKFGLNIDKMEFIINSTSVKDCEFVIKDNLDRVIYGRCIWAAEFSDVVTPHIRFIVTEKRKK